MLVPAYYLVVYINAIKLEPGRSEIMWVHSQNGNDHSALLNITSAGNSQAKLNYTVDKYAEIGIIDLPDEDTIFPPILDGRKIPDFKTAPFVDGLTILDHNKICNMDGVITYWSVVSKEDENKVQLAVFRYAEAEKKYQLVQYSPSRVARKGLNTFFEKTPLDIKQNDILGIITKKSISSNRVMFNDLARVLTLSGHRSSFNESEAISDRSNGSFSFSALLEAGKEQGEIFVQPHDNSVIKLPQNPVYGHLAWYKFTFFSEDGIARFIPNIVSVLLNANPFIGLTQDTHSPWTPKAFSLLLLAILSILFGLVAWSISPQSQDNYRLGITIVGVLAVFGFAKYFLHGIPGLQFVTIVAAFIMVFLLPGIILSRYYSNYGKEFASGRIVMAFVLSLSYWFIPAVGLFLIKTSYWPAIAAAILLIGLALLKNPVRQKREVSQDEIALHWKVFRFSLWGFVLLLAVHTLFSSRFHAESFDTFHHLSLMAKNFELPISGDVHTNLYDESMRSIAPYSYNYWGMLVGMVVKISSLDIGTIYCVGSSLLVLLMFIAQWWLIGLFVNSEKIRMAAFTIILMIYLTRTLGVFAPIFQRSEFVFIMYGPSVFEYFFYAVYIVLGVRLIQSSRKADLLMYCSLSLATAFFHMEFIFINSVVLFLLIVLSLRKNGEFHFNRTQIYLLSTIALLIVAGGVVTSHLTLGKLVDAQNPYYQYFYSLRYEESDVLHRFYYIFCDLLKFINTYIWNAVAVWGGLLLVKFKFQEKNRPARLFRIVFFIMLMMLLISFNPISDMIFTPLMTSWPLQRIPGHLPALMFTFAAVTLSISFAYAIKFAKNKFKYTYMIMYALPAILSFLLLLTADQWLPQTRSTVFTTMYNQGNYFDITSLANLPEFKYLNEYSKGKRIVVLVEKTYYYAIPSLSYTYSYYHSHYPDYLTQFEERRPIWKACLNAEKNCRSQLPDDSVLLVRNADMVKFDRLGYLELFRGRLFTVLKV